MALACCRRALELKSDYAEAHNNLGNALKDLRKVDESLACYRRALELKPDFAKAHYNLGSALEESGEFQGAEESFRARCGTIHVMPWHITTWRNCSAANLPSRTWRHTPLVGRNQLDGCRTLVVALRPRPRPRRGGSMPRPRITLCGPTSCNRRNGNDAV